VSAVPATKPVAAVPTKKPVTLPQQPVAAALVYLKYLSMRYKDSMIFVF